MSDPLEADPLADLPAARAACRQRILEREGVAVFLGLQDARPGRALEVTDSRARADGARLAELLDAYDTGLAGLPPDPVVEAGGTEGADWRAEDYLDAVEQVFDAETEHLIEVLLVLGDAHLRVRR